MPQVCTVVGGEDYGTRLNLVTAQYMGIFD